MTPDQLLTDALTFVLTVYQEQLEHGTQGDQVYIANADKIIDRATKAGLIVEVDGIPTLKTRSK